MTKLFKKGQIGVVTKLQSTSCGIKYLKKGSIVKIASDTQEFTSYVRVFRNLKEQSENDWHMCDIEDIRHAEEIEVDMYTKGIYFLKSAKIK